MSTEIDAAVRTTGKVQEEVAKAIDILQRGFNGQVVNGAGVYADPLQRRAELLIVLESIEMASRLMNETAWPVATDYEASRS